MIYDQTEYAELMKRHFPKNDCLLDIEIIKDPPAKYIKEFFEKLLKHERYEEIKGDFVYDAEKNVLIQVHNRFSKTEISDLTQEEVFFYPFMDKKEIKQIFNITSASDYLLRLRAEQVGNEIRLKRTFSNLKKKLGEKWSFTNYFDSSQYRKYLIKLKPERRKFCTTLSHGTIHSNEANGMCFSTPFGNIIVLSYALKHFLFYMNIFFFGIRLGVKEDDVFTSFILALRIMIGNESLDFEIDPRGRLPKSIKKHIDFFTDWQMNFIIGHEYAHHYLGHIENDSTLKSHNKVSIIGEKIQHYTYQQNLEFEADFHSISETKFSDIEKSKLIDGAFLFFSYLDMYDRVEDYLYPRIGNCETHPKPIDRIWKLRDSIDDNIGTTKEELKSIINENNTFVEWFLKEHLPYHVEEFEMIGSIYLHGYKKKILIDRLDF